MKARILAPVALLVLVLGSAASSGYAFGVMHANRVTAAVYGEGFENGRDQARAELATLLLQEEGLMQPIEIPEDADCLALTLLSARAGALTALQSVTTLISHGE